MKKLKLIVLIVLMLCTSFCMMSCSDKVSDELSTSAIKNLLKTDTLYENILFRVQKIQDSLSKNVILSAKFSDITYRQCLKYEKERIKQRQIFIKSHMNDINKTLNDLKNKVEEFNKLTGITFYNTYYLSYTANELNITNNLKSQIDTLVFPTNIELIIYKELLFRKYKITMFSTFSALPMYSENDLYECIINIIYDKEWISVCKKIDLEVFEYYTIK